MNFTLREYFYKLSNTAMVMMLLPMAEFLAIYYLLLSGVLPQLITDELLVEILLVGFPIGVVMMLTIVQLGANKRFKKIANEVGLGKKLDLYLPMAKRKINSLVWASFFLAIGFFLTAHEWFSIYFGVIVIWSWWQWPSPKKLCRDLKLKGDEREMVLTKGEAFKV